MARGQDPARFATLRFGDHQPCPRARRCRVAARLRIGRSVRTAVGAPGRLHGATPLDSALRRAVGSQRGERREPLWLAHRPRRTRRTPRSVCHQKGSPRCPKPTPTARPNPHPVWFPHPHLHPHPLTRPPPPGERPRPGVDHRWASPPATCPRCPPGGAAAAEGVGAAGPRATPRRLRPPPSVRRAPADRRPDRPLAELRPARTDGRGSATAARPPVRMAGRAAGDPRVRRALLRGSRIRHPPAADPLRSRGPVPVRVRALRAAADGPAAAAPRLDRRLSTPQLSTPWSSMPRHWSAAGGASARDGRSGGT